MSPESAAAIVLVLLTVGALVVWQAMERRPGRFDRFLSEAFWARVMGTAAIVAAVGVVLTAVAAGVEAAGDVLIVGLAGVGVPFIIWTQARTFGPRR